MCKDSLAKGCGMATRPALCETKQVARRAGRSEEESRNLGEICQGALYSCQKMPQHTMAYRIARAIIVDNATKGELANVFSDLDPPRFCRVAQKRGCKDMARAIK
ncbi:unnamed protein product [Cylindrotheca closterium]|uniref:Uncharacterized protein n=1 Tax=Cylindrotheca closterium TaxID=2856 RepID=A0AAD2GCG7_9STRA|nr:unnamed protein product [Cylindrotheca closterium]